MQTGRERFQRFLNHEPLTCPVFIPFIGSLLSRVADDSMESLTSNPALWANNIVKTTRLFGFDGMAAGFGFHIAGAACGCAIVWENDQVRLSLLDKRLVAEPHKSPQMALALDVAKRVFSAGRVNCGCIAALSGPYRLAADLFGSRNADSRIAEIKPMMVHMAKAYCETRPDALIFREDAHLSGARIEPGHRRIFQTLKNIASYYDIPAGLYIEDYRPDSFLELAKLGMDIYILGPSKYMDVQLSETWWALGEGTAGLGIGLPLNDMEKSKRIIDNAMALYREDPGHSLFFTSSGAVGRDIDLDNLHALVGEISKL